MKWLESLTWVKGSPIDEYGMVNFDCVLKLTDGTYTIIGEVNHLGGYCDCCGGGLKGLFVDSYALLETK